MNIQHEEERFYIDMGFRLKQVRQFKKVRQSELAEALGLVTQTVQKYESGEIKMSPEVILRCASVFKVPVGYFYGEEVSRRKFSRFSLMIASDIMLLPSEEIQKNLHALVKNIVAISEQNNKNEDL